mgnify:CR=1 FL=1
MALPTLDEFRRLLTERDVSEIVNDIIISNEARHVNSGEIDHIKNAICAKFGLAIGDVEIYVVGSAKLGFSLVEKQSPDNGYQPRYREYRPGRSDVDIAVVSGKLFQILWRELAIFSHSSRPFPWRADMLGSYMVVGWLRQDHFPKIQSPSKLTNWSEVFRELSVEKGLGYRKFSGGLYFSRSHLERYQARSVAECQSMEKLR